MTAALKIVQPLHLLHVTAVMMETITPTITQLLPPTASHFLPDKKPPTFSTDPREWEIKSHKLMKYRVSKGPQDCQNSDRDFKRSLRDFGSSDAPVQSHCFLH